MPRHSIELAKKHYEELPAVLKQALFSTEIAEQMFEIGKKFGLTIEKIGIMAEETGYIMLGLTRPNELVGNLAAELGVDSDKAQDIAAEINHLIFFPLREELKRTHDFDMGTDEVVGSGGTTRVSGMQMPPGIKKTLTEEKSPLISDLTRARESPVPPIPQKTPTVVIPAKAGIQEAEQKTGFPITSGMTETSQLKPAPASPPSFQPPASPTGRIDDLRKMVEKPPLPIIDLRQTQSALIPPPPAPSRAATPAIPPLPAPPSVPRMTPQLQDLVKQMPGQNINKSLSDTEIGPTLLEEKLRLEPQEKAAAPKIVPAPTGTPTVPSEEGIGTGSDPYREPVDETNV